MNVNIVQKKRKKRITWKCERSQIDCFVVLVLMHLNYPYIVWSNVPKFHENRASSFLSYAPQVRKSTHFWVCFCFWVVFWTVVAVQQPSQRLHRMIFFSQLNGTEHGPQPSLTTHDREQVSVLEVNIKPGDLPEINIFVKTAEFVICIQNLWICAVNEEILKNVIYIRVRFSISADTVAS